MRKDNTPKVIKVDDNLLNPLPSSIDINGAKMNARRMDIATIRMISIRAYIK
jgi:hypothetical protein